MKKLKLFALGLLGASMFLTTSCEDDDPADDPTTPMPTLTVRAITFDQNVENGDIVIAPNTEVAFAFNVIKAGGGKDLDRVAITQSGANSLNPLPQTNQGNDFVNGVLSLSGNDETQYIDTLVIPAAAFANIGVTTYVIEAVDNDGLRVTRTIQVDVQQPTTPLATEVMGAFFHVNGSLQGAYDLVLDTVVASGGSANDKDMENTDAAGDPFTGSWTAANSTSYVKDNGFDYNNATLEAAQTAFAAGSASGTVTNPAANDIYVARLRGGADYAVIKITNNDPSDNTCACGNTGKLSFDYKKQ